MAFVAAFKSIGFASFSFLRGDLGDVDADRCVKFYISVTVFLDIEFFH